MPKDRSTKESAKTFLIPANAEPHLLTAPALCALEKERQRLLDEIQRQESMLAEEHSVLGHDVGDIADHTLQKSKAMAMLRLRQAMLKEVEHAIVRAEEGLYGLCERCGKPISKERLEALPSAVLCIDCAKLQVQNVRAI